MPIAPTQNIQIVGNNPDFVTIQIGPETIQLDKDDMKARVQGGYRCHEQLKWAIVLRLFSEQTDLSSNAAIKAAIESGVYFY